MLSSWFLSSSASSYLPSFGRLLHLPESTRRSARTPFQEDLRALDLPAVLLLGHLPYARRRADPDVVVQARPLGQRPAGPQLEYLTTSFWSSLLLVPSVYGPNESSLGRGLPAAQDPREPVLRERDVGERLRVLEADVVLRRVLLDQLVLQQQRLHLGPDHYPVYLPYLGYQHASSYREPLGR